ncbi:MAG: outer membrane beta-barrel protein [Chitinophagaceae bacterium]|nr:outer membrane beta-barrel protein [Chitinophagaceae bacterium]
MKQVFTLLAFVCLAMEGIAQDTTTVPDKDTIRVGNIIIVRSGKDRGRTYYDSSEHRFKRTQSNVTTNWFVTDIGVNQVNDKTNYAQAIANGYLPAGANENWFDQRFIKSTNVNIWFFVQRLNMIEHVVNLKYGLGIELNNYRYTDPIRFQKENQPLVIMENVSYKKNKLAADYVTVPLMLNFNFTPNRRDLGFGFSAGMSAGYLYSARQKTVGGGLGKKKEHDDFDLRKVKLAYIAEISLGPVRLYGSYATRSMFKNGLDQTPYSFGIRASSW